MQHFSPGSLVKARGRDWIVLPESDPDVLRVRPLTSAHQAEEGLFLPLERDHIRPASFVDPDPARCGDATGVMTLFDAARLSLRSGAAPFRSLGRISVVPRPYQFVPLIMALRLDPVRMLIADDVGVGKTIEAGLIARELLDRGIAKRLGVLCPAHLTDQWERELREKFLIDAALVQPGTFLRLERNLPRQDIPVYAHYSHLVASIDFVKSDRHKRPFLDNAPDLIIVDEAHMAARPPSGTGRSEHQRHELLHALAEDPKRHIILVTATPHSGYEESFRSLLGLLDPQFDVPTAQVARLDRRKLLPLVVQRRRSDVEKWMGADTPFPKRLSDEVVYDLSPDYRDLFNDVLEYCRETIAAGEGLRAAQQRVRHWAAIALLRCLLSSPQTARTVLENRQNRLDAETGERAEATEEEVDETYRPQVMDALGDSEIGDYTPTAPFDDPDAAWSASERRKLRNFRRRAVALAGPEQDRKLAALADSLKGLLGEGYHPIVFCRYIQTAHYLAAQLPDLLKSKSRKLDIRAVTGEIGDGERRERIDELVGSDRRILIATDCLSEGINLQEHFDAVVHYDLPWNPNRLEQREGRVDRYGQPRPEVKAVLIWGENNQVDQVVLDVLIRKAHRIRRTLGVSVPVPVDAEQVVQTIVDNVLLRGTGAKQQLELGLTGENVSRLHAQWDLAADREKDQRAFFAHEGIQPDAVQREIEATDSVLGEPVAVQRFLADALQRFGGSLRAVDGSASFELRPGDLDRKLADTIPGKFPFRVTFDRMKDKTGVYLGRTHTLVERVCDSVLGDAFATEPRPGIARAGAMVTDATDRRTVVLLLRFRYLLKETVEEFAEEVVLAGFRRGDNGLQWLTPLDSAARALVDAALPTRNISDAERTAQVDWALATLKEAHDWYAAILDWRLGELVEAHKRLRDLTKAPELEIQPHSPPDILGCFVLVPGAGEQG